MVIDTNPHFYTARGLANLFDVTSGTVRMWANSGIINVSKKNDGHWRISAEEYERLSTLLGKQRSKSSWVISEGIEQTKSKLIVLIIEDDKDLQILYRLKLEEWSFPLELLIASDGYEALLIAGSANPDIIITDLKMPNLDGFHMIDVLSSNTQFRDCLIVVVTGLDAVEIEKKFPFPDDVHVLSKPIPFEELRNIVESKSEPLINIL